MEKILFGKGITEVRTLGSMYDNQSIRILYQDTDNHTSFARIKVSELLPLLQKLNYLVVPPKENDKRQINTYLKPIISDQKDEMLDAISKALDFMFYDASEEERELKLKLEDVYNLLVDAEILTNEKLPEYEYE